MLNNASLGNGRSISLWHDSCLSCGVIVVAFPRLFRPTIRPTSAIPDVWNSDHAAWDIFEFSL